MSKSHPTTTVDQRDYQLVEESDVHEQYLENQPMELCSKNRIYTTTRQRERLGINDDEFGRGIKVHIQISDVKRNTEWGGGYVQTASFDTELRTYGVIGVPQSLVETFDLDKGDNLRVNIEPTVRPVSVSVTV